MFFQQFEFGLHGAKRVCQIFLNVFAQLPLLFLFQMFFLDIKHRLRFPFQCDLLRHPPQKVTVAHRLFRTEL